MNKNMYTLILILCMILAILLIVDIAITAKRLCIDEKAEGYLEDERKKKDENTTD